MKKVLSILIALMVMVGVKAQYDCLYEKSAPKNAVTDFTGTLSQQEGRALEGKLRSFNDTTSSAIIVVFVNSLCGETPNQFATTLGHKWGVGDEEKDNGIVVLVKPKEVDGKGEVYIATGYGLEAVVPDGITKRIIEQEMIPQFKNRDYYAGVDAAVDVLISLSHGEYTADDYKKLDWKKFIFPLLFIIIVMVIVFASNISKARRYSIGHDVPFWTAFWLISQSNRSHGGTWGNFSSGSGSFGGGGFGGFGGGSFGGGGAGGSW